MKFGFDWPSDFGEEDFLGTFILFVLITNSNMMLGKLNVPGLPLTKHRFFLCIYYTDSGNWCTLVYHPN